VALYTALTGSRFATDLGRHLRAQPGLPACAGGQCSVFNVVFGKTVPDISLNAVANLGYAAGRFGHRSTRATR
jgi:2-methylfumaryl-CoA hydratase